MRLSALTRRRLAVFRRDARGMWSLRVLGLMLLVSLPVELWCNPRPLLVRYEGHYYFPAFVTYPESQFGGTFETEADYHDPQVAADLEKGDNFAVFPPVAYDYRYVDTALPEPAPSRPSRTHLLGTDDRARVVHARLVYGFRLSMGFGLALAAFGTLIGILVGAVQGYIGGRLDLASQRVIEVWSSQNELYILLILSSIFEPSLTVIFCLLSLFGWMGLAAYVRAEFLRARQYEFVQSAIALGASRTRVMFLHILPNALTPVLTFLPFRVSAGIMGLTALDFLALGVPPPTPSLGELLSQGKSNLNSWWIIVAVFVVLAATIMLLNFIGEALQRAFDARRG